MAEMSKYATIMVAAKSWDETTVSGAGAHSVAHARFTTEYSGDLVGESSCSLLICYVDGDPADPHSLVGPYSGYEHVTGTLAGRSGAFVLAANGEHTGGVARTEIAVVPGSGTGELAGLRGSGEYAAEGTEYSLRLDYYFEGDGPSVGMG